MPNEFGKFARLQDIAAWRQRELSALPKLADTLEAGITGLSAVFADFERRIEVDTTSGRFSSQGLAEREQVHAADARRNAAPSRALLEKLVSDAASFEQRVPTLVPLRNDAGEVIGFTQRKAADKIEPQRAAEIRAMIAKTMDAKAVNAQYLAELERSVRGMEHDAEFVAVVQDAPKIFGWLADDRIRERVVEILTEGAGLAPMLLAHRFAAGAASRLVERFDAAIDAVAGPASTEPLMRLMPDGSQVPVAR